MLFFSHHPSVRLSLSLFLSTAPARLSQGVLFNKIYEGTTTAAAAAAVTAAELFLFLYQPLLSDRIYTYTHTVIVVVIVVVDGGGGNSISHARAFPSTYNKRRRRAHTDTTSGID